MNRSRRNKVKKALELFYSELDEARDKLIEVIEEAMDEEQEAYDNLPYSFQDSERGEQMSEGIDAMFEVVQYLEDETTIGAFDSLDELVNTLEIDLYC